MCGSEQLSKQSMLRRYNTCQKQSSGKRPAANAINEKSKTIGFDPFCCADDSVKPVLELGVCDTNVGKNFTTHLVGLYRIGTTTRDLIT